MKEIIIYIYFLERRFLRVLLLLLTLPPKPLLLLNAMPGCIMPGCIMPFCIMSCVGLPVIKLPIFSKRPGLCLCLEEAVGQS